MAVEAEVVRVVVGTLVVDEEAEVVRVEWVVIEVDEMEMEAMTVAAAEIDMQANKIRYNNHCY